MRGGERGPAPTCTPLTLCPGGNPRSCALGPGAGASSRTALPALPDLGVSALTVGSAGSGDGTSKDIMTADARKVWERELSGWPGVREQVWEREVGRLATRMQSPWGATWVTESR